MDFIQYRILDCFPSHLQIIHIVVLISFLDHLSDLPIPLPRIRSRVKL